MEITGVAYRAAYAVEQGLSPTGWDVPATVPVYVEDDELTQIGSAALTQDPDGTVNSDAVIDEQYARWTHIRPYMIAILDNGAPDTVLRVGIFQTSPDVDQPTYTVVTP